MYTLINKSQIRRDRSTLQKRSNYFRPLCKQNKRTLRRHKSCPDLEIGSQSWIMEKSCVKILEIFDQKKGELPIPPESPRHIEEYQSRNWDSYWGKVTMFWTEEKNLCTNVLSGEEGRRDQKGVLKRTWVYWRRMSSRGSDVEVG